MKIRIKALIILPLVFLISGCSNFNKNSKGIDIKASHILGNPDYPAVSYGGYRHETRDEVPSVDDLKEDMKILGAMGIKLLRTYNTQQFAQAANLLEAISQLEDEDPGFEMYVMLGAWIDCENAWTDHPNHEAEDVLNNSAEIEAAVKLANKYPGIVKIIAVGNEAMIHWASSYFVYPDVILKWVNYLKALRERGKIPGGVWITSSDNFESWGGGSDDYHTDDLTALLNAVDYISLHTYPFHDTHYNPAFWLVPEEEKDLGEKEKVDAAMLRAKNRAVSQYESAAAYIKSLGIDKPIHIGETGWASISDSFYGKDGSRAADEYKEKLFYDHMREWTNSNGISCFFFEAFDEQWKDQANAMGPENHFGLINLKGEAKFALWEMVDKGVFDGLTRGGLPVTKTYGGDINKLMEDVYAPPSE
jgi:exo-beta-1,3-glucanase (GH17 family)